MIYEWIADTAEGLSLYFRCTYEHITVLRSVRRLKRVRHTLWSLLLCMRQLHFLGCSPNMEKKRVIQWPKMLSL